MYIVDSKEIKIVKSSKDCLYRISHLLRPVPRKFADVEPFS